MSSYYPYQPGWHGYRQNNGGNGSHGEGHGNENAGHQELNNGKQKMNGVNGGGFVPGYQTSPQGSSFQGYPTPPYTPSAYQGSNTETQYMIQLMINLGNQLDQLNQLIAQNNQMLQNMYDQEDTKCIQGTGGGAVIVRM